MGRVLVVREHVSFLLWAYLEPEKPQTTPEPNILEGTFMQGTLANSFQTTSLASFRPCRLPSGMVQRLYTGYIGVIYRLYWDNGKQNGSYYLYGSLHAARQFATALA